MKQRYLLIISFFAGSVAFAQNIGINTDGSAAETGLMLDVKIPTAKGTTSAAATFFQVKSLDADADALKLRFGLKTDATATSRYGFLDFADLTTGTPTYRNLSLQPSGGNVGIGTTAPSSLFDVYKANQSLANIQTTLASNNILIQSTYGAGSVYWPGLTWYTNDQSATKPKAGIWAYGDGLGSKLFFGTSNSYVTGVTNTAMVIDPTGNVGIGTTAPTAKLSLGTDLSLAAMSTTLKSNAGALGGTAGNELILASFGFTSSNQTALGVRAYRTSAGADWTTSAVGIEMDVDNTARVNSASLWLSHDGSVGIGMIPSGSYKLEVNGRLKTTGINETSDIRLKKNILTIENALSKVEQMRGVIYEWRADEYKDKGFDTAPQIGLIAQEVEKIFPQLVGTDNSGFKSVEYSKMVAVLIEAIKEQQQIITSQKAEIGSLKGNVIDMKKDIASLKTSFELLLQQNNSVAGKQ